jgi:hypothetical protein
MFLPVSLKTRRMQPSKSQAIRNALEANDWPVALRVASRFYDRSADTAVFKRGLMLIDTLAFTGNLEKTRISL